MSKGIVHRITTISAAAIGGTVLFKAGAMPLDQAVAFASGCATGVLLTPDLDLVAGSDGQNMARRAFGWALSAIWRLYWIPYSLVIPHRSFLSHGPVIGTIGRLIYVSIPAILIYLGLLKLSIVPQVQIPWNYAWSAVTGLMVADLFHYILDKLAPG